MTTRSHTAVRTASDATIRNCRITGTPFALADAELELLHDIPRLNPALGSAPLPEPAVHPLEELRRVSSFGGLLHLYRGESVVSGALQLTRFDPALGFRISTSEEFASGEVDNTSVGMDYDFQRPFFEQWATLLRAAVLPPLNRVHCEQSEYTNAAMHLRRCYLCFAAFHSEDCLYCLSIDHCRDCHSCVSCRGCELCTDSTDLTQCYAVHHSSECRDSFDLFGCLGCRSCRSCFGCVGLERSEYAVFNEVVGREAYERFVNAQSLDMADKRRQAAERCFAAWKQHAFDPPTLIDCSNVSGAHLTKCQDVVECYNGSESRECGYLWALERSFRCYRGVAIGAEFCYTGGFFGTRVAAYCNNVFQGEALTYSQYLYDCNHCFGCVGLRKQSYCILNKQYSREEYLALIPRVIAHMRSSAEWGAWFPPAIAPHDYRECSAHEHLSPIPFDEARRRGYRFTSKHESAAANPRGDLPSPPQRISPENFSTIAAGTFRCVDSGKLIRYQRPELEYLRRNKLPLPYQHWLFRLQHLIARRALVPAV